MERRTVSSCRGSRFHRNTYICVYEYETRFRSVLRFAFIVRERRRWIFRVIRSRAVEIGRDVAPRFRKVAQHPSSGGDHRRNSLWYVFVHLFPLLVINYQNTCCKLTILSSIEYRGSKIQKKNFNILSSDPDVQNSIQRRKENRKIVSFKGSLRRKHNFRKIIFKGKRSECFSHLVKTRPSESYARSFLDNFSLSLVQLCFSLYARN